QASRLPEARVQALCALDGLRALTPAIVAKALADKHPRVREQAVRLCEQFIADESLRRALVALVHDLDRGVRLQLALTLGEFDDPRAGEALAVLAGSDDARLPHFRAALLSSAHWHPRLAAILGGEAPPPPQFALLADTERARLEASPAATAAARAEVLRRYEPALSQAGNVQRGVEIFARACALCHALGGIGFDAGPNLAPLHDKPADYLLKNILDPNAAIEPRFITQIVELKDGRTIASIIASESATSLTLKQPGGAGGTVLRGDVRAVHASKISLMPEDFERSITPQEMADLIAFLRSASGNAPK
ncbi:MAG TPA: HEAT repeat domain-containing protein, partial [Chthoniobacteraceae bacterium]|nr:HEAT repeat domain-containing protein [Chthoniobacteraceae bacterium]